MNLKDFSSTYFRSFNPVRHALQCFVFVVFFAMSLSLGHTQPSTHSPFERAIAIAIDSNPRIHTAKAAWRATQERYDQSIAALLPVVSLNASQSRRIFREGGSTTQNTPTPVGDPLEDNLDPNSDITDSSGSDDQEILTRASINVTQPLFRWQSILALQQTTPLIASAKEDLNTTTQEVLLETIQTIITLLLTDNVAKLAENNLTFTRRNLAAAEARRKAGHLTRTDVNQASARVASAEAELIRAKNDAMLARARFEEVVGIAVPEGLIVPHAPSHLLQGNLQTLLSQINNRPDIKAARLRLESADYAIKMEQAGHFPILDLTADATAYRSEVGDLSREASQYSMVVQFSLPLYSGGRTLSKTRETRHIKASRQAEFDRMHYQAQREVNQAYLALYSAKATVTSSEAAFQFYREAVKGMQEEFDAGFRTVIDLLDIQNKLFQHEIDRVKSYHELTTAQYQLLKSLGHLTMPNLQIAKATAPYTDIRTVAPVMAQDSRPVPPSSRGALTHPVKRPAAAAPIKTPSRTVAQQTPSRPAGPQIKRKKRQKTRARQAKSWDLHMTRSLSLAPRPASPSGNTMFSRDNDRETGHVTLTQTPVLSSVSGKKRSTP